MLCVLDGCRRRWILGLAWLLHLVRRRRLAHREERRREVIRRPFSLRIRFIRWMREDTTPADRRIDRRTMAGVALVIAAVLLYSLTH